MTNVTQTLYVHRVADWRAWLRKHHKTSREIWLIYYRKSSGKPRISYNDSVEEALCFGWIDSIQKKIDDDRLAQRFTPRRPGSKTSEMNKARARRLVRERRMTPAGLAVIGASPPRDWWSRPTSRPPSRAMLSRGNTSFAIRSRTGASVSPSSRAPATDPPSFGSDSSTSCARARRTSASGWCRSEAAYAIGEVEKDQIGIALLARREGGGAVGGLDRRDPAMPTETRSTSSARSVLFTTSSLS